MILHMLVGFYIEAGLQPAAACGARVPREWVVRALERVTCDECRRTKSFQYLWQVRDQLKEDPDGVAG